MDDMMVIADRQEYYDIVTEQEAIFQWEQEAEGSLLAIKRTVLIGMQFYQGEPVQLWGYPVRLWEEGADSFSYVWDICLYRQDGSREVLLPGVGYLSNCHGYLDQDGNFYWWKNTQYTESGQIAANACLKKYSPSGEMLFEKQMEPKQDILEIRQTADGRMYLILCDRETESRWLAELEPDTGLITKLCRGQPIADATTDLSLGIYGNKPVILNNEKFVEINADDGTESLIFSLDETTYTRPRENNRHYLLQDFRIPEDGSVEIIWATSSGSKSLQEKLQMAKVEKIPVVLNARIIDTWLSAQISSFNQSNETYQVIVETGTGDWEDFARLTSVQIASGKGPDILSGDLMQDYIPSMMEKGTLEDLNAYMKESGIREGNL